MTQVTIDHALRLALAHQQAGRAGDAESIYRAILAAAPNHPGALHQFGMMAAQVGRLDQAAELIRQAILAAPREAEYHTDLADVLLRQGHVEAAIAAYERALAIDPEFVDAHNNLGLAWLKAGNAEKATACFERALAVNPTLVEAMTNLGNAYRARGQFDQAISWYERSLALKSDSPDAHCNLGVAFKEKGELDRAIASFHKAIALRPQFAQAWYNLGVAMKGKGQLEDAIACYQQSLQHDPGFMHAHNNLGNAWKDSYQLDAAIACYEKALAIDAHFMLALNNLGNAQKDTGQLDLALANFRKARAIDPAAAIPHNNMLTALHYHPASDSRSLFDECRRWNREHAQPLRGFIQPHANDRDPDRRLRIGYVSPDLRNHPVGRFMLPVLAAHDRADFEIFAYAHAPFPDEITATARARSEAWRPIENVPDAQLAAMIRDDRIDILVDLALHTANNRLLVFARKPAPVQVTWLGYPGTTGLETIDYRFTDPYLDPPDGDVSCYSEKTVRLPDTFWCYDAGLNTPAVNALPSVAGDILTFGCLNAFCKVNDAGISLWAKVLAAVPGSRMVLLTPAGQSRRRVLDRFAAESIDAGRIAFVDNQPRNDYLRVYHRIDIALDTIPYNGHTTSLDAFWMGVPVVTLIGKTIVGRAGFSQLSNLGMSELIADAPEKFVRVAATLARDVRKLIELRRTLRGRLLSSPLMDAARMTRGIESAYRSMWRTWCAT
jgi:predicted O-linked N-acetylglucosamine transferase (SPINDLY family)